MRVGTSFVGTVVFALVVCGASCRVSERRASALDLPAMGINPMGYTYYGTALPFVDVAHMSNKWITQQPTQLTSTGYPTALAAGDVAQSLVFTNNGGIYPTGQYTLQWQGNGAVQLTGANISVVSSQAQQIVYRVNAPDQRGLVVQISQTDPANPVRAISVKAPFTGTGSGTFNPLYEKDLANYGVLRYMGWNATNDSTESKWSDRTTPASFHWGGNAGVPYEYQIQLSNELKQDLWITVPHLADDDYVRNLGQLVNQTLAPGRRVWIEYSNEVWNGGFQQSAYARDVLQPKYGLPNSAEAYGRRAAEVFDAFSSQFTDQSRLVRVLSGQTGNSGVLSESIKGATINGKLKADVAAVAPYFTLDIDKLYDAHVAGTVNMNSVFTELHSSIDTLMQSVVDNQHIAAANGLPLVAYEGGQHLVARPGAQHDDQSFVDLLSQINHDDRMGQLYTYLLDQWYSKGGKTFVLSGDVATSGKWGSWGLQENYLDTNAVKYKAVQQYIERLKSNRNDFNKDGVIDQRDYELWRSTEGASQSLLADSNEDGAVDSGDYVLWRKAADLPIGAQMPPVLTPSLIPEPGTMVLAFGAIYISLLDVRRTVAR